MIDRIIYNHRNDENQDVFKRLASTENIPRKEKSFIGHISGFCHTTEEVAQELWDEFSNLEQELLYEKRNYRTNRVLFRWKAITFRRRSIKY